MAAENTSCVTLPPVEVTDYTPKGSYTTIANIKSYISSTPSPSRALVLVYDVFGFSIQALQGADRLSQALNALVIAPGLLGENVAQADWYPPDSPEKQERAVAFREGLWLDEHPANLKAVTEAAKVSYPGIEKWGVVGLCWGGKIAVLGSIGTQTLFLASGQTHPAKLTREDAEEMHIPHILLASSEEPKDMVAAYAELITGEGKKGEVETYPTSHHGWMGARARLAEEGNRKEYERGYDQLAAFFAKHL